ncbi:MAG: 4Fe-4S dicluster domain-containing protein [Proteobacteria bacterium]|nr:4Fe-4S ferredoxin [Desulfobulbaceae bacterium]MBU4152905.1 4Fe-4S dicluster domain-containing protein [Pseudomonadota bacterium]
MTNRYILKKDHLPSLLRRLMKEYRLVAPVKNEHGDTMFSVIDSIDRTSLDLDSQPQGSIKPFLFPQQEVLFDYQCDNTAHYEFNPNSSAEATVFFGIRSCDLSAVLYMDVIFSKKNRDSSYFQKRNETVLIALACNEPFNNCFCNATKSGPFLEYGFDLQFTDLEDRYLVESGRAKGEEIIARFLPFFTPAGEKDAKGQYQAFLEARSHFKQQVHVDQVIKRLKSGPIADEIWAELSLRCQDCGGCAYVCPTCTCFTITDLEITPSSGKRIRSWDACTFAGFTRMAGGHNPVDSRSQAIKQRFLHKLLYDAQDHGRPSCVGCGRCVGICFGGVDIIRFIAMACD